MTKKERGREGRGEGDEEGEEGRTKQMEFKMGS